MQALRTTVYLCHSPGDARTAADIAQFLERGADVQIFIDEGRMWPGQDPAEKLRDGYLADVVLLLLSRDSVPSRWPRAKWEDVLLRDPAEQGVRMGFVKCDDSVPPRVLQPQFDLSARATDGLRQLKRWVRHRAASYVPPLDLRCPGQEGDVEVLGIAAADRTGAEMVASVGLACEFARTFRDDFDEVFVLACEGRSLTALAGDLGEQLGLGLEGEAAGNLDRVRAFCAQRRFLLLLTGAASDDAMELIPGGRCSTLLVEESGLESGDELHGIQRALRQATPRSDWTELCSLARAGRRITVERHRIAECFELMQQWHRLAEARADRRVQDEAAREMVWILQSWGKDEEARLLDVQRARDCEDQMVLPF